MLFERRFWPGIADGSVTRTFRRWRRRHVVAGRRYRTPGGIIEVEEVSIVDPSDISDPDARRSGYADAQQLVADLRGEPTSRVYRVVFHVVDEPDPRAELASKASLTDDEVAAISARLAHMDEVSASGPWTWSTLQAIEEQPATRAAVLAVEAGRELQPFKRDVRKLKQLGLTESLEVGYRLSPRGHAYVEAARTRSSE
jgi:hypothetical protein